MTTPSQTLKTKAQAINIHYIDFCAGDAEREESAFDVFFARIEADEYAANAYNAIRDEVDGIKCDLMGSDGAAAYYRWTAPNKIAIWILADNGLSASTEAADTTLADMIERWDAPDGSDMHELRASWGLDPIIDPAAEEDTDVRIWIENNYYSGTINAPADGWLVDDDQSWSRDPLIFATYSAAQHWIDEAESGIYYLSHGEAGRPAYTI